MKSNFDVAIKKCLSSCLQNVKSTLFFYLDSQFENVIPEKLIKCFELEDQQKSKRCQETWYFDGKLSKYTNQEWY